VSAERRLGWRATALAVLVLLVGWHLAALLVDKAVLPTPAAALRAFASGLLQGELGRHLWASAGRVLASLLWATALAVPLGLLLGRSSRADRLLAPLIYIIYPVPKIVFLPVVLVLFGLGNLSKVFLIGLIIFFQILVTTRDAARAVAPALVASVRSLGAGEAQVYRHVVFPAALPKILTSLRIGLGTAIAVLFITETVATTSGVGYFLMDAWTRVRYDDLFAGVLAMGLMGFGFYIVLDALERWLCPWQR